jgi:hypothetical protein
MWVHVYIHAGLSNFNFLLTISKKGKFNITGGTILETQECDILLNMQTD